MRPQPHDPSKTALFHPEIADTVFQRGAPRPATLALAVEAARLAYLRTEDAQSERARLEDALQRIGCQALCTFDHPGTDGQGFGATFDDTVLLAFRGTQADRITDIVTDIETIFRPWDMPPGQVHKGFGRTAEGLWQDDVKPWLQTLDKKPAKLIVCGHSLGAAIATLLVVPAHQLLKVADTELVTIGSPRVGDQAFVSALQGQVKITRIVNCCDVVTQLPPPLIFVHAGEQPLYIDRHGDALVVDYASDEAGRLAAREDYLLHQAWRFGTVAVRDLADHAPANYLRAFWP